MSLFASISDPTDLDAVRRVVGAAPRADALIPLDIDRLIISGDAALRCAEEMRRQLIHRGETAAGASILMLVDSTPIRRGDSDLKAVVETLLVDAGFSVSVLVLGDPAHGLHADDAALDTAVLAASHVRGVVSVGSGTISDIAKVATDRVGGIPLVLIQTAASVDGFTDNVSVVLRAGAKRTVPSRWPDVVLADTTTIRTAPQDLNTSGFGELLSLYTAPSDWWLASAARLDDTFHETPRDLLLTFVGAPREWAAGLAQGSVSAVEQLTRVLAIRGIGTGIAGTTACLSGVEHLVSHMLDMHAASQSLPVGLHGAQVGVASLVAAAAWEFLAERILVALPAVREIAHSDAERTVRATFARLDPSGGLGDECWRDCSVKLAAIDSARPHITRLVGELPEILASGALALTSVDDLAAALRVAGAAADPRELQTWLDDETWRWAVMNCHRMRNRFTVVDLLDLLGWWEPADVDQVLHRARRAAGAVPA